MCSCTQHDHENSFEIRQASRIHKFHYISETEVLVLAVADDTMFVSCSSHLSTCHFFLPLFSHVYVGYVYSVV